MKLIIMTQPAFFVEEDKILTALFEEGMDNLHLCKPDTSPMYWERLLSLIPESVYGKITVHDHFYLKREYGLAGIHIDDPLKEIPKDYKGKCGRTCSDASTLNEMKRKAECVFLSCRLGSAVTSDGTGVKLSRAEVEDAARRGLIDKRVYAFGDIDSDNIKAAKDLGFGGVVVCGDLWKRFDIHSEQDYKELIAYFEKLRKLVS